MMAECISYGSTIFARDSHSKPDDRARGENRIKICVFLFVVHCEILLRGTT